MSDNTNELLGKFDGDIKAYTTEPAPAKKQRKQKSIYGDQLLCLAALTGLSIWQSGLRALIICLCSVAVCVLSDMLFCRMSEKTYNPKDLSTITTGICIALMMPASVNYGIVIGAALLALSVKHIFGGKDNYIFNPTCVAIAFLIICYPTEMLSYPAAGTKPEIWGDVTAPLMSGTESYLIKLGTAPALSFLDIVLGNTAGPMGTTHFFVMLVCAVCLMCRRSMSVLITLFGIGSYCALSVLFPVPVSVTTGEMLMLELSGGYLLFGFIFLVTDPQTTPGSTAGKISYGILIGIVGCLFRHFGKVEGSFIFVLLIANALSVRLDDLCAYAARKIRGAVGYMRKNMGRYERLRNDAENNSGRKLSDTMEIIVPPTNYYMPPIDNKVTKINRKKTNIITRYAEKLRLKRKKDELIRRKQMKESESNYISAMRSMQRKTGSLPEKTAEAKSPVFRIIKQPLKRSLQKNNKQGGKNN